MRSTAYWVANKLNELGIRPPCRSSWSPKTVIKIVSHKCYTGKAEYNANGRVPNPEHPLGDLTLGVKRTLVRPKPDGEKVIFEVPSLITDEQWVKADRISGNEAVVEVSRVKEYTPYFGPGCFARNVETQCLFYERKAQNRSIIIAGPTIALG